MDRFHSDHSKAITIAASHADTPSQGEADLPGTWNNGNPNLRFAKKMKTHWFALLLSTVLAAMWWLVFYMASMGQYTKVIYSCFLPLTAAPYIMWVIHKEGQEPPNYIQHTYGDRVWLVWLVRIFMMIVVSALSSIAAVLAMGAIAFLLSLFHRVKG
jgi:hypothetical protein